MVVTPDILTLDKAFRAKLTETEVMASVVSFMGGLALVLAVVGLYGVVAYNVVQRTREIGIRVALGASPANLIVTLLAGWIRPLSLSVAVGALLTAGLSMALRSQLYGLSNFDPLSYAGAFLLLAATGALAVWVPARRALKIDPIVALRCE